MYYIKKILLVKNFMSHPHRFSCYLNSSSDVEMQVISKRTHSLKGMHVLHVPNPPDSHRQKKPATMYECDYIIKQLYSNIMFFTPQKI